MINIVVCDHDDKRIILSNRDWNRLNTFSCCRLEKLLSRWSSVAHRTRGRNKHDHAADEDALGAERGVHPRGVGETFRKYRDAKRRTGLGGGRTSGNSRGYQLFHRGRQVRLSGFRQEGRTVRLPHVQGAGLLVERPRILSGQ
jgi:hypothetical protein